MAGGGPLPFICECADERCTRVVSLTLDEYEEVRSHPARSLIVRGHAPGADHRVVRESERYAVVERRA